MAKITSVRLRQIIKEELMNVLAETNGEGSVTTGSDIKGATAVASNASQKIADSSTIKPLLDKIKTTNDLAAFLQQITDATAETGLDQREVVAAVKKFGSAVVNAKPSKPDAE